MEQSERVSRADVVCIGFALMSAFPLLKRSDRQQLISPADLTGGLDTREA